MKKKEKRRDNVTNNIISSIIIAVLMFLFTDIFAVLSILNPFFKTFFGYSVLFGMIVVSSVIFVFLFLKMSEIEAKLTLKFTNFFKRIVDERRNRNYKRAH